MLGGTVHRGVTAREMSHERGGARVLVDTPEGEHAVHARYVVGGDGMHSFVRAAARVEFDGGSYEESFVLADVKMDWALGRSEVSLFFSAAGMIVVAPLPNGDFRIVATLEDAPAQPGVADMQRLVDARGPTVGVNKVHEVAWSSRFRLHHRVARAYRSGPLFLMGDSAHVHSPAGGQGMNTGLVDAIVLGQLLTQVVRHGAPDARLDVYGELRRPAATKVLGLAGTLTGMAAIRSAPKRIARNAVLRVASRLPVVRRRLQMGLSGLARKEFAKVGSPAPAARRA